MSAPILTGERSMRANLRIVPPSLKSLPGVSASRRPSPYDELGREWGCKGDTAKDQVYGERGIYKRVAQANAVFLRHGLSERVMMLMAPIDASLFTELPDLEECIYRHNKRDAQEDVQEAEFIRTRSDAALAGWVKELAADIKDAERLLAALVREQDERKAAK